MNKHIEHILIESGADFVGTTEQLDMSCFDPEEFAKLLINDCIRTVQMGITRNGVNTPEYNRSIKHITDIQKRFDL